MVKPTTKQILYIVFDKLPKKCEGGLVATYINLTKELQPYYRIEFVGIFDNGENDIPEFNNIPLHVLSKKNIDNRFFSAINYLREGKFHKFFHALASAFYFFGSLPINKIRSKQLLSNQMVIASSPAAAMFLSKKIRYILEIHTAFEYFWGTNILGKMQSALIPPAAITVFRNKSDAEKAKKLFPATYIYNAFNASSLPIVNFNKKTTHSALFVGRLVSEKNPLRLLDCAYLVKQSVPNFVLDIYGNGPLTNALHEKIDKMNLQDTVHLKGFIDNKAIYQKYDLLWVTSNFEGFGLVIIEAMANGIPCVSSNWGDAISEIIEHEKTGCIAQNNKEFVNYTISLLSNSEAREEMSKNAYMSFQQKYTCETNTQHWLGLLKNIYTD